MLKLKLTVEEAYRAMFHYLEHVYDETRSKELAEMLGSMSLLEDGKPADTAVWEDWIQAVKKVKEQKV